MAVIDQGKLNHILALLEKIKFGSVTIVIHEGQITQLDVVEKHRFQKQGK
ncbi:YezD family protein [Niallia sp. Krafla_26]